MTKTIHQNRKILTVFRLGATSALVHMQSYLRKLQYILLNKIYAICKYDRLTCRGGATNFPPRNHSVLLLKLKPHTQIVAGDYSEDAAGHTIQDLKVYKRLYF